VTDTANSAIAGTSNGIAVVTAGRATHFVVSAPSDGGGGCGVQFHGHCPGSSNNVAPSYSGTMRFTSNGYSAMLPPTGTLTNGVGAFAATLSLSWSPPVQTITATDVADTSINGTFQPDYGESTLITGCAVREVSSGERIILSQ